MSINNMELARNRANETHSQINKSSLLSLPFLEYCCEAIWPASIVRNKPIDRRIH